MRDLKLKSVLLAPTGRAAKVLSRHAGQTASTIHRHIYRPKKTAEDGTAYGLMPNRRTDTLFIVDEASMIGEAKAERTYILAAFVFMLDCCGVH